MRKAIFDAREAMFGEREAMFDERDAMFDFRVCVVGVVGRGCECGCGWWWVPLHYLVTSENDFRLSEAVIISSWVIELILWPYYDILEYAMHTQIKGLKIK